MTIPYAMTKCSLKVLPAQYHTMLCYVIDQVIEEGLSDSIGYDFANDEITYHRVITELDRSVCPQLEDVQEIWVIQAANAHS